MCKNRDIQDQNELNDVYFSDFLQQPIHLGWANVLNLVSGTQQIYGTQARGTKCSVDVHSDS